MFRPATPPPTARGPRRGAILIVVLALLALFAVVGLAFVFYSDSEAKIYKTYRDALNKGPGGLDAFPQNETTGAAQAGLSALLFEPADTELQNALRGQSLLAAKFGRIPHAPTNSYPYLTAADTVPTAPYSGVGTFHEDMAAYRNRLNAPLGFAGTRGHVINYTSMQVGGNILVFDPEWTGSPRTGDPANGFTFQAPPTLSTQWAPPAGTPPLKWLPKNAPYTYPDLNNLYLASLSPATGEVLSPSFHRAWLFNAANTVDPTYRLAPWNPNDTLPLASGGHGTANNTDWISPEGRLKVLRPRPIDQLTDAEFVAAGLPGRPLPGLTNYPVGALRVNLYTLLNDKIQKGEILGYPPPDAPADPKNAPTVVTYSGDLANLLGGVGRQTNDSVLMDTGAAPIPWNGKFIKPLLSFLVTDLDGLLDLTAHGNAKGVAAAGTSRHRSHQGWGPWEVNLNAVLTAGGAFEADALVQARYGTTGGVPNTPFARRPAATAQGYTPVVGLAMARGDRLPLASLVNWDGTGTLPAAPDKAFQLPAFTTGAFAGKDPFLTSPRFDGVEFYDDDRYDNPPDTLDKAAGHPALYNPAAWPAPASAAATEPFTFPASDLERLRLRYADALDTYKQTAAGRRNLGPGSVVGTAAAGSGYRLDPAHPNRLLLTTLTAGLDRPGLAANFGPPIAGSTAFRLNGGLQLHPTNPAAAAAYAAPTTPGGDAASAIDGRNARAVLGPVDVNRPLADYRADTTKPLFDGTVNNVGNEAQARLDRQNLCRDIFARLVVATGAQAEVYIQPTTVGPVTYLPGDVLVTAAPGTPEYNALRYLAQLAANIVDYTDNDDISTPFVWCPVYTGMPPGTNDPLRAYTATDYPVMAAANLVATQFKDRVVFGAEKSRLVVNEVYAETTNDPTDNLAGPAKPTKPAQVRFWVELLNPSSAPYQNGGAATAPLGDGSAWLWNAGLPTPASPYKVEIVRHNKGGANVPTNLQDPANVTGEVSAPAGPAVTADVSFNFSVAAGAPTAKQVAPNGGQYSTPGKTGFVVLEARPVFPGPSTVEFTSFSGAPATTIPADAPASPLTYSLSQPAGSPPTAADLSGNTGDADGLNRHVVLLRRLANPYLPFDPNLNPFVSVDYMDYVPAHDAVRKAKDETMDRMPGAPSGYIDRKDRAAVGKVQPYAGYAAATAGGAGTPPTYSFPASAVLAQQTAGATDVQHSLLRHNGTSATAPAAETVTRNAQGGVIGLNGGETIMAPFDWLVHLDRPLVNNLELLHVQGVKPHEVTQWTLRPPAAGAAARKWVGNAPWLGVDAATGQPHADPNTGLPGIDAATGQTNSGLFRALELVRVRPWYYGAAAGGRVHGKVNLNTIQDKRVLLGLLDPQAGNRFTSTEVDALWTNLIAGSATTPSARTRLTQPRTLADTTTTVQVPVVGQERTYHDADPADPNLLAYDRPFQPFGVAEFGGVGTVKAPSGIQDTVLRATTGTPTLWLPNPPPATPFDPGHPYLQSEMARKLANNTTTVSNVFAVHLTVVWYEVRVDDVTKKPLFVDEGVTAAAPPALLNPKPARRYRLGKEAVRETPGDMRQQYFAVVDRSQAWVGVDPATLQTTALLTGQQSVAAQPPFSAALDRVEALPPGPPGSPTHKLHLADGVFNPSGPAGPGVPAGPQLTVFADGQPVVLGGTFAVVVGAGAGQEVVTVQGVDPLDGGLRVVQSATNFVKPHLTGELVANGVPGHPGPQDGTTELPPTGSKQYNSFDLLTNPASRYKALVPYFQKASR